VDRPGGKKPEDLGIYGKIILKWFCRTWDVGHGLDSYEPGQGQMEGRNEHVVSIKCREFLG